MTVGGVPQVRSSEYKVRFEKLIKRLEVGKMRFRSKQRASKTT